MKTLRARLSAVGVKRRFLDTVVFPSWWEDSLAANAGGFREAAAFVCSRLGFSLASLLDNDQTLVFADPARVRFKKAKGVSEDDICLATHYALGLARTVASAFDGRPPADEIPAPVEWRNALIARPDRPWVTLPHILEASWKLGIPVLHLRHLPAGAKKPDALTTMVGDRPVIVVLSGRKSPSWIAFIVAHELGHIHHRHLKPGQTLVDEKIDKQSGEKDEGEANDFASRLLTGHSDIGINSSRPLGIKQLAESARTFGESYRIAPAVAALNYGFTTGEWAVATGAVGLLEKDDAATCLEKAMDGHLALDSLSDDSQEWVTRATSHVG